jgi:hypothetical protein
VAVHVALGELYEAIERTEAAALHYREAARLAADA